MSSKSQRLCIFNILFIAQFALTGCTDLDQGFMPHGFCLSWDPKLLGVFVLGNLLVALSYYSIPAALWVFIQKRKDLVFDWMFRLFAAFIFCCGTTHVMKLWTIWHPAYWAEALMDLVTGVLSAVTAILLWRLIPVALGIKSPTEWEKANKELSQTVDNLKQARDALHENQELTRLIIERAQDAFVAINSDNIVFDWNDQATKLFGLSKSEVVGKPLSNAIIPGSDINGTSLHQLLKSGEGQMINRRLETVAVDNKGREFPVELSVFSVGTEDKTIYAAFIHDIAERKQAEDAVKYARDQALEASRFKSEFLANMSHEIRTPMNGILGMADVLRTSQIGERERAYLDTIYEAGESLLTVLNDILDFSKIEAGKLVLEEADFAPVRLVEGVADLLSARAREKNLSLLTFIDPQIPETLLGDQGRLRQVLVNLVSNAIKFSDTGAVLMRASVEEQKMNLVTVRFSVTDQGSGMKEEDIAKLFEPFVQVDGSITRRQGGTGLGLSICKRLVELMHGQIDVHSVVGHGSQFWFTVPLTAGNQSEHISSIRPELQGTRVLIVDDEESSRNILFDYLNSWGMHGNKAKSAGEAIEVLKSAAPEAKYDVAIIDLVMPGVDGLHLAKEIREEPQLKDIKLILLTAFDKPGAGQEAVFLGFDAYLTKPLKQSLLLDCISSVLHEAQTERQQSKEDTVAASAAQQIQPANRNELILIVEDHKINQEVAFLQLRNLGFESHICANGVEALELVQKIDYALILMDCQMPEMDGFEATRAIRKMETRTGKHVPIVAMTAHALEGSREACLSSGMDDYVSKPISALRLQTVLRKWISAEDKDSKGKDTRATAGDQSPIRLATLQETFSESDLKAIIDIFVKDALAEIEQIKTALKGKNTSSVLFHAHGLKGISGTVHADKMVLLCEEVEKACNRMLWADLPGLIEELEKELSALQRFVRDKGILVS